MERRGLDRARIPAKYNALWESIVFSGVDILATIRQRVHAFAVE